MAALTKTKVVEGGIELDFVAVTAVDGDNVAENPGNVYFVMKNDHASDDSVFTVEANGDTAQDFPGYGLMNKANQTYTVGPGDVYLAGPFPPDPYNDTDGLTVKATGGTPTVKAVFI